MHVCSGGGAEFQRRAASVGHMQLDLLSETGGDAYFGQGVIVPIASEEVGTGMNSLYSISGAVSPVEDRI